jgi:tetratricopeptide (TPR) repeat protein
VARTPSAANRPSIAAGPSAAGRAPAPPESRSAGRAAARPGLAAALLCAALAGPAALAQTVQVPPGTVLTVPQPGPANQLGAPEPMRPTLSVPYDGALVAWRAGRVDEALSIAEKALQGDPRNPQLRFLRGTILAERGRIDEAVGVFRALVDDFPELPEPYNNLAVIHANRGELDAARIALEQSIRAVPTYALAHENLGDVLLQQAVRAYEQAGRLDPRNESARGKLALARELTGRVNALPVDSRNPRLGAQPR